MPLFYGYSRGLQNELLSTISEPASDIGSVYAHQPTVWFTDCLKKFVLKAYTVLVKRVAIPLLCGYVKGIKNEVFIESANLLVISAL